MLKTSLNESILDESQIVENDELPQGILARVRRTICQLGQRNGNNRVYEKAVWEHVINDPEFQKRLMNRQILGNAEHPKEVQLKLDPNNTSHVISRLWIDESTNTVKADFDLLPTDAGKFIHILHEAGVKVPASTRADGELEEALDESGNKYMRVIPEKYRFICVDHTGDPSCQVTEPDTVISAVKRHYEAKEISKNVAMALLEGIKTEDAKKLESIIESDKAHDGCKCKLEDKKCSGDCSRSKEVDESEEVEEEVKKAVVLENDVKDKYKVVIPGFNQNLPEEYQFTHAKSDWAAVRQIISRVARAVENLDIDNFKFGSWQARPENVGGISKAIWHGRGTNGMTIEKIKEEVSDLELEQLRHEDMKSHPEEFIQDPEDVEEAKDSRKINESDTRFASVKIDTEGGVLDADVEVLVDKEEFGTDADGRRGEIRTVVLDFKVLSLTDSGGKDVDLDDEIATEIFSALRSADLKESQTEAVQSVETAPDIETLPSTPDTAPATRPEKPINPIRPKPGIHPKPKARVTKVAKTRSELRETVIANYKRIKELDVKKADGFKLSEEEEKEYEELKKTLGEKMESKVVEAKVWEFDKENQAVVIYDNEKDKNVLDRVPIEFICHRYISYHDPEIYNENIDFNVDMDNNNAEVWDIDTNNQTGEIKDLKAAVDEYMADEVLEGILKDCNIKMKEFFEMKEDEFEKVSSDTDLKRLDESLVEKCGKFKKLIKTLSRKGIKNPKSLAASMGRKKKAKSRVKESIKESTSKCRSKDIELVEIKAFIELANESFEALKESAVTSFSDLAKLHVEVTDGYATNILSLSRSLKESKERLDKITLEKNKLEESVIKKSKEIKELSEKLDIRTKEFCDKVSLIEAKRTEEVRGLQDEHKKALLSKYLQCKLELTGLSLPEAVQALLGQCESEEKINEVLEGYKKAVIESGTFLPHSVTSEVPVQPHTRQDRTDKLMEAASGGIIF